MCRVLVPQLPPASVPSSSHTPRLKNSPNPYLPALLYRPWHKLFPGSDLHPPLCLTVSSSTLDPVQESHHPEASSGQPGNPVPLLCNPIAFILYYCLSLQGQVRAHSIWGGMHSNAWEKLRWEWKREQGLFYYLYLFWLGEALLWDKLCQPSGPPTPGQADASTHRRTQIQPLYLSDSQTGIVGSGGEQSIMKCTRQSISFIIIYFRKSLDFAPIFSLLSTMK